MTNPSITRSLLQNISSLQANFSEKECQRFQLSWLSKAIQRVGQLPVADEALMKIMAKLNQQLDSLQHVDAASNKQFKTWILEVAALQKHLLKQYKISKENHYTQTYLALGMCLGMMLGSMISVFSMLMGATSVKVLSISLPIGMTMGMCAGVLLGGMQDKKAKEQGLAI